MSHELKRLTLLILAASLSGILLMACDQGGAQEPVAAASTTTGATADMKSEAPTYATPAVGAESPTAEGRAKAAATKNQIVIDNFAFVPAKLDVSVGTKVTWLNKDDVPHTATSTDKRFNSGAIDTDGQFSFVFKDKGDYAYFCSLHPQMKGHITVK